MAQRLSQDTSLLRFETPLGGDVLVPVKLEGNERVSENFDWNVYCLLNDGEDPVDPMKIIGKACHALVDDPGGKAIYHGLCTDVNFSGWRGDYALYHIVLRPWTWLLTRETNCEIFHEKKANDIIQQIFNDRGFTDFRFSLSKSYDSIPYCVQYQETTYDFVSRLMEKYGMFFYFTHTESKHELVVCDDPNNLPEIEADETTIKYQTNTETGLREHRIFSWDTAYRLRTGEVDVDDYNYEKPNTKLERNGKAKDNPSHSHASLKHYVYPSGHLEPGQGQTLADIRIDVERADAERKYALGNAPTVRTGAVFQLDEHPIDDQNNRHFGVAVTHQAFVRRYLTSDGREGLLGPDLKFVAKSAHPYVASMDDQDYYVGEYEFADISKAYKAPMKTPSPRIHSTHTAEVIRDKNSPSDEEIDVDDQGRILVKFHWNPRDANSDKCSCRVRVAQIWAGSGWGGVWIPRVGMEAVIDFIDGDPDQPLCTGTVYNGKNKPPIKFPNDKTQSTVKSQSSKGGTSADNFNEIRFEDKKDDEEIYIHAERDRRMIVEHDDDVEIGNDRNEKIGGSHTWELTGGDQTITLKGAPGTKDKYGSGITKNGHRTTTLEMGDETLSIDKGKRTTTIKMDDKKTITDGNEVTTISKGNQTTKISLGKGTTTAMQSFEIKVGASSIKLEPAKITIKSVQIDINASAMLKTSGGAMAKHSAGGLLQLQGALIKIN